MSLAQKELVIEKYLLVSKRIYRIKNRKYVRGHISLSLPAELIGKRVQVIVKSFE